MNCSASGPNWATTRPPILDGLGTRLRPSPCVAIQSEPFRSISTLEAPTCTSVTGVVSPTLGSVCTERSASANQIVPSAAWANLPG